MINKKARGRKFPRWARWRPKRPIGRMRLAGNGIHNPTINAPRNQRLPFRDHPPGPPNARPLPPNRNFQKARRVPGRIELPKRRSNPWAFRSHGVLAGRREPEGGSLGILPAYFPDRSKIRTGCHCRRGRSLWKAGKGIKVQELLKTSNSHHEGHEAHKGWKEAWEKQRFNFVIFMYFVVRVILTYIRRGRS